MRAALVIVMLAGAAGSALACPQFDFDDVASGGAIVAENGEGLRKIVIRAVPSRPSFYFHHGEDDRQPAPTFTEDDGTPIAVAAVYTGIPEYPIRYDLAITSGTVVNTQHGRVRFEVSPGMTPHTREVRVDRRYGKLEIAIDTDAALLQFEEGGETWTTACWQHMTRYFDSEDVRITAIYANRTELRRGGTASARVVGSPRAARRARTARRARSRRGSARNWRPRLPGHVASRVDREPPRADRASPWDTSVVVDDRCVSTMKISLDAFARPLRTART